MNFYLHGGSTKRVTQVRERWAGTWVFWHSAVQRIIETLSFRDRIILGDNSFIEHFLRFCYWTFPRKLREWNLETNWLCPWSPYWAEVFGFKLRFLACSHWFSKHLSSIYSVSCSVPGAECTEVPKTFFLPFRTLLGDAVCHPGSWPFLNVLAGDAKNGGPWPFCT